MANTHKIRSFATSVIGASHIGKQLPCQDASLAFDDPTTGLHVAIVSDGHGSSTYVRSDRGSRIAVDVARRIIIDFVDNTDVEALFGGKAGRVTTQPSEQNDPLLAAHRQLHPIPESEKTQQQRDEEHQNNDYYRQTKGIEYIEQAMRTLFTKIYIQWFDAISIDASNDPFTNEEKALLGNNRLEKAYGATLMAFVGTPKYWFAFHLGDGKMLAYNPDATWNQPVPWDHKCFLNLTTSLCQRDCVERFRYAFDATGSMPIAVFLGSDGLDDTWQTMRLLQDCYLNILKAIADDGIEPVKKQLTDKLLPDWSRRGSTDDMSVAAVIDLAAAKLMRDIWDQQRIVRSREIDLNDKQIEIEENNERLAEARENLLKTQEQLRRLSATETQLKDEIARLSKEHDTLSQELKQHNEEAKAKTAAFAALHATLEPEPLGPPEFKQPADSSQAIMQQKTPHAPETYCKLCNYCQKRNNPTQ